MKRSITHPRQCSKPHGNRLTTNSQSRKASTPRGYFESGETLLLTRRRIPRNTWRALVPNIERVTPTTTWVTTGCPLGRPRVELVNHRVEHLATTSDLLPVLQYRLDSLDR